MTSPSPVHLTGRGLSSVVRLGAATLLAALVLAAPAAAAGSIVFIKGGDVWLASPDGSVQRQVTVGQGWSLPSQADDGTLLALRGGYLHHPGSLARSPA